MRGVAEDVATRPVTALDVREVPQAERLAGVSYETADIRDAELKDIIAAVQPRTVVHLASVVAVGGDPQARLRDRRARHAQCAGGLPSRPACSI